VQQGSTRGARTTVFRRSVAAALGAGALVCALAALPAAADVTVPTPLGPIDVPLPDPTTTTTQPAPTTTTTAPAPSTTTTTAPPVTTTTAPPRTTTTTTTARSTTTTTGARRSTTTTAAARGGAGSSGSASGPSRPRTAAPSSRHRTSTPSNTLASGPRGAAHGAAAASGETISPTTAGSRAGGSSGRLRSDFARSAALAPGHSRGFDGSALAGMALALATALVLGIAQRDAARQRRSQTALVGAGALRLGRDASESGVREQLNTMLVRGPFTATGVDCRSLQLLVQAAAHEGLEVRDPRGFIVRASNRLVRAYGSEPDHKRLPLRWTVEVAPATRRVPDGYRYVLERTGPDERGRVLAFSPGTDMRLWSGDCL
jgi:hypothetical protein